MKVAVCYRGHLRTLSQTFESHKKYLFDIFGDCEIDFFCHTWNIYDDQIEFLKNTIKPKRLLVEEPKLMEKNPYNSLSVSNLCFEKNYDKQKEVDRLIRPYNTLSLWYSCNKVNSLRKEYSQFKNISYDWVIDMRPDLYFHTQFNYDELELDKLNVSWWNTLGLQGIIPNDHIAISSESIIDSYSDVFLYIPAYYFNENISMIPELVLNCHLNSSLIEVKMLNLAHSMIRISGFEDHYSIDK